MRTLRLSQYQLTSVDLDYLKTAQTCAFEIPIDPYLQLTSHGLMITLPRIPREIRQEFTSFYWKGDYVDRKKQRWGIVIATKERLERKDL